MGAADRFAGVVGELEGEPEVSTGTMFGSPGLKVSGRVFAMVVKERLVVKLPRERVQALLAAGSGAPFDPGHGRVMKEWVAVDEASGREWLRLAREAMAYVGRG
jgi:TfoX/Sxy family transcriptional regulator of competence genes